MKSSVFFSFLFVLAVYGEVFGATGADFLKITPGAVPAGMGGAYTVVADDINALYYNPAGIVKSRQYQVGVAHTNWLEGIRYNFIGAIIPTGKGAIGISAIYLTTGKIEGRDEEGNKSSDFYSSDMAITLSIARRINSKTQIGGSLKIIREIIADEESNGFAIDIGMKQEISKKLNLGLSLKNLGTKMKFIKEKYSLPFSLTTGISYNLADIFNLAMDITYEPIDKKRAICIGTELMLAGFITLRAGYLIQAIQRIYNFHDSWISQRGGFAGGFGIKISDYNLDYAIIPYSDIGTTQRISFKIKFK